MKFDLIDAVLERSGASLKAMKAVTRAEEYLGDHFPGFPVLPGVMMLETMVQAARLLLEPTVPHRLVLGEVRALKYGAMVRPGDRLVVEVSIQKTDAASGVFTMKGTGTVLPAIDTDGSATENTPPGETAVSGRFTMRPIRPDPVETPPHD